MTCQRALAISILLALSTPQLHGQVINETLEIIATDGALADNFGFSIAIDDSIVAIGAYQDDDNGTDSGSVYIYNALTGSLITKIAPNDGSAGDFFGRSIAIDNGIVAIAADRDNANGNSSGSVYLFNASTGQQLFKLLPNDGAAFDFFGNSVAFNNGIVAIGAHFNDDNGSESGSAYLFDASTGSQLFKLLPTDGSDSDFFGESIAINNGIVAVGAQLDSDNGTFSGSAYLFDASTGAQLFKLLPDDGAAFDAFGRSIAIADGVVAVGAYLDDDNGTNSGSAYLFNSSTGTQFAKLSPIDGDEGSEIKFGNSIAIANGIVAVGAYFDEDNGFGSGSAYLFDAKSGNQISKLLPTDGSFSDKFGSSIAIDTHTNTIAVGANHHKDDGVISTGAAFIFAPATPCPADLTGEGDLNFLDISAFLTAYANQDPIADFQPDGLFNFLDVSAFLVAYGVGCP